MRVEKTMKTSAKAGAFDYLTPLYLVESLGPFDLDPCGWPGHPTAKRLICMPEDGLAVKWKGRVWLNPPFGGQETSWLDKLCRHGNGIAIVPSRTDTAWFLAAASGATSCFFMGDRVNYLRPGETIGRRPSFGSVLLAYGEDNIGAIIKANLIGVFLDS